MIGATTQAEDGERQQVTVAVGDDAVVFIVRRQFDIEPVRVVVPFDMLDMAYLQRLAKSIQARQQLVTGVKAS